jgi:hypothetical protein
MPCTAMIELETCFNVYDSARRLVVSTPLVETSERPAYYEAQAQSEIAYLILVHANSCAACRSERPTG